MLSLRTLGRVRRSCNPPNEVHISSSPNAALVEGLLAEFDGAAWSTLYSTRSYPSDPPETGKIAVKVINTTAAKSLRRSRRS